MVGISRGTFHITLLTPRAKLLDCKAGSVVLPFEDGQWGIMRNHCPVLAKLGQGVMQVREIPDRGDAFYIVEGGFVRVSENHATVLAYDVLTFEDMPKDRVQEIISKAKGVMVGKDYISTQLQQVDYRRSQLIVRMAELAEILKADQ